MYKRLLSVVPLLALALPTIASAHEVYVLTGNEIAADTTGPAFDMVQVAIANMHQFVFWAFIAAFTIMIVFVSSILRPIERLFDPVLMRMKPYAPAIARITVGLGLIAGGYYGATYGPELPLTNAYGNAAHLMSALLIIIGTLITIGFHARIAALVALCLYGYGVYLNGWYMVTYFNYFGEFVVLILLGSHRVSVHSILRVKEHYHRTLKRITDAIAPIAFAILRVSFGLCLIYASAYAKILHNNLALQVASVPLAGHPYPLAYYLGFEPHFLVLGAAIVEIVIGLFFVLGIEIRFTSLFMLFWLSLSLWFFGESVWPHIVLIGLPIAFIFHGYDKYSLEGYWMKRGRREPVL